jgi:glycosyltransferase involved in cell wall biosynthesis
MDISIVIPFFNEEENVILVLDGISSILDRKGIDYEVVAVNNNSTDRTGALIEGFAATHPRNRYVLVKERGYGNAVRGGLAVARGKWIGWTDGDLQIKPIDVYRVIDQTIKQNAIFCKAERRVRFDGVNRFIFTHFYRIFSSLLLRRWMFDVNGKPKFFRRSLYTKFTTQSSGWFIDAEFVYYILHLGAKIIDVPITFYQREKGKSSVNFRTVTRLAQEIVQYELAMVRDPFADRVKRARAATKAQQGESGQ